MRQSYVSILLFLGIVMGISSCVKDEFTLNEGISVTGLDPTFAIPLAHANLGLEELVPALDLEETVYSESGQILAISFTQTLFELGLQDLLEIPDQEVQESYVADLFTAAIINTGLEGDQIPLSQSFSLPFDFENGEILDSILLQEASLDIRVVSTFKHDLNVNMTIPELTQEGSTFQGEFYLDYQGSVPVEAEFSFDISESKLDFTSPGNGNALNIIADFIVSHSGEFTNAGDSLYFELSVSSNSIHSAYGYLGQYEGIAEIDTQRVDIFQQFNADELYFEDPAIELLISNSSGIPLEVNFSSLFAPENSGTSLITGGALEDIPTVSAAQFLGDIAYTTHRIDNTNTSPLLSDMLNEGPVNLIYTAAGITNPEGFQYNFIEDTSKIRCDATVILPLSGYVDGYHFNDTLPIDIGTDLGLSDDGPLSLDDVYRLTLRIIADNGLPAQANVQMIFMDENYQPIDSLFNTTGSQMVIAPGLVNASLAPTDPGYGRVVSRTRAITDIEMSVERLENLIDGDVKFLEVKIVSGTTFATQDQVIRLYPEDGVEIQLSAKLETRIDITE
jgi:hypothetical protein